MLLGAVRARHGALLRAPGAPLALVRRDAGVPGCQDGSRAPPRHHPSPHPLSPTSLPVPQPERIPAVVFGIGADPGGLPIHQVPYTAPV